MTMTFTPTNAFLDEEVARVEQNFYESLACCGLQMPDIRSLYEHQEIYHNESYSAQASSPFFDVDVGIPPSLLLSTKPEIIANPKPSRPLAHLPDMLAKMVPDRLTVLRTPSPSPKRSLTALPRASTSPSKRKADTMVSTGGRPGKRMKNDVERERSYVCPKEGCTKTYLNPNGLKYHLRKGTCVFDPLHDNDTDSQWVVPRQAPTFTSPRTYTSAFSISPRTNASVTSYLTPIKTSFSSSPPAPSSTSSSIQFASPTSSNFPSPTSSQFVTPFTSPTSTDNHAFSHNHASSHMPAHYQQTTFFDYRTSSVYAPPSTQGSTPYASPSSSGFSSAFASPVTPSFPAPWGGPSFVPPLLDAPDVSNAFFDASLLAPFDPLVLNAPPIPHAPFESELMHSGCMLLPALEIAKKESYRDDEALELAYPSL